MQRHVRPLLHLCAIALAAPQVLLFTAFALLGHLTSGRTLGSLFMRALETLDALLGWAGALLLAAIVLLIAAGFARTLRPFASAVVILAVICTTIGLIVQTGAPELSQLFIFIPGLLALALSALVLKLDIVPA